MLVTIRVERFSRHEIAWPLLIAALLSILRFLYLGDTYLLGDETLILLDARHLNEIHQWARHNPLSFGHAICGPLASWIYQLEFLLSKNLYTILALKIAITNVAMLWCFYEIGSLVPKPYRWAGI